MKLQQLLSLTRQAIDDYNMIDEGDCIAIGISGGKDSLVLLETMAALSQFYPKTFKVKAITVNVGFTNMDFSNVSKLCAELNVEYKIINTDIFNIVFNERKEKNPCSLCSKLRKGALYEALKDFGCNKVAYAHHCDDVIDTAIMSLLYEGHFHTFAPVTYLQQADTTIIRPFIYIDEKNIKAYAYKNNLPIVESTCPVNGITKRQNCHDLINQLFKTDKDVKKRIFNAVKTSSIPGWNGEIGKY